MRVPTRSVWGPYPIGRAMQVGASHRAAKVPNARWRRRQWRSEREQERQLQARPLHQGGDRHPPVATRGYSYAPRAEKALRMTIKTTERSTQDREIDMARK